ncbi:MAG: hypothetical protein MHPSP_001650, partial [Paramarteilia canceri]
SLSNIEKISVLLPLHQKKDLKFVGQYSYLADTIEKYIVCPSFDYNYFVENSYFQLIKEIAERITTLNDFANKRMEAVFPSNSIQRLVLCAGFIENSENIINIKPRYKKSDEYLSYLLMLLLKDRATFRKKFNSLMTDSWFFTEAMPFILKSLIIQKKLQQKDTDSFFEFLLDSFDISAAINIDILRLIIEYANIEQSISSKIATSQHELIMSEGKCSVCNRRLQHNAIPYQQQIEKLKEHMLEKITSEIYFIKRDFDYFQYTLDRLGPFDGVVDFANLYFSCKKDMNSVEKTIDNFREKLTKKKKILFINKTPKKLSWKDDLYIMSRDKIVTFHPK